ncbi:MAG: DNRLRE domain-containing protein [Candidatus Nitrosopumilus sp. bin_7KS]
MKVIIIFALIVFSIVGLNNSYADSSINLEASQDSYLRKGASNTNEGANWNLIVKAGGDNQALVSFDLTGISTVPDHATLELFAVNNGDNWGKEGRDITLHRVLATWTEGNGFNTKPGNLKNSDIKDFKYRGDGDGVTSNCSVDTNIDNGKADCENKWKHGSIDVVETPTDYMTIFKNFKGNDKKDLPMTESTIGWVSFDITADLNSCVNENVETCSWMIQKFDHKAGRIEFASTEGAINRYNDEFGENVAPRINIVIPEIPQSSVLFADKDAYLRGAGNTNEGANWSMSVQAGGTKHSLVSFDLDSYTGNQVSNAKLQLYVTFNGQNWGNEGRDIGINRLTMNWAEGNGFNQRPDDFKQSEFIAAGGILDRGVGEGVTNNCAIDLDISNGAADCDLDWKDAQLAVFDKDNPTDTLTIFKDFDGNNQLPPTIATSGWMEFDVTSDVNMFLAGDSPNYGWIIQRLESGAGNIDFATTERATHFNEDIAPRLILDQ